MKKIFTILLFLFSTVIFSQVSYQTVDDFNRADNNTLGTTSSGNSVWLENELAVTQFQISSNALFCYTGALSGPEPTNASIDLTNEIASFDLGNGSYGWSFHMDLNRAPSGWGSASYSLGWVIAGNENDFSSNTVSGWAILWTYTNHELVLGRFSAGISGNDPLTVIIHTGLSWDVCDAAGVNIRSQVDASGNWAIWWEEGAPINNVSDIDANSATSINPDNTYFDDSNMKY